MQEEVENRTVTLVISATKLTGRVLKAAVAKFLAHQKAKIAEKKREKVPKIPHPGFLFLQMIHNSLVFSEETNFL